MVNVLSKIKKHVNNEAPTSVAQVFPAPTQEVKPVENEIVAQQLTAPKVIKQNNPGTPTMGFTLKVLGDEFGKVVQAAMHEAGITSVEASIFGVFDEVGIVPRGFHVVHDQYINKKFYTLKNTNRVAELFKRIAGVIGSSNHEVISFPYTTKQKIKLPLTYDSDTEDYEMETIEVETLCLTPKELDELSFAFIKEVQFCAKLEDRSDSVDLIAFKIDREVWRAAPYKR